jgi:hypothetical protein
MAWELTGNAGTDPTTDFVGTTDGQPLVIRTNNQEAARVAPNGQLGVGTASPNARLSIVAPSASELGGTAPSTTLLTSSGPLGEPEGSEIALASFGFSHPGSGDNDVSLGIRATRTAPAFGWPNTAIGLGMDVDDTVRAGASLWLHANGHVGIGTVSPSDPLTVHGIINSSAGGFRFPDGSIQSTATLRGPQGPQGQQGATGPSVKSVATVGPNPCNLVCGAGKIIAQQNSPCIATSETGTAQTNAVSGQWCCVCRP